jgi:hypothetical protein
MIESRAGQLLPISAPKDSQSAIVAERQQKRILDKVWDTVEKAMGEMRTLLVNQLREPGRAIEDQEKTIERVALSFVLFKSRKAEHGPGFFWSSICQKIPYGYTLMPSTSLSLIR